MTTPDDIPALDEEATLRLANAFLLTHRIFGRNMKLTSPEIQVIQALALASATDEGMSGSSIADVTEIPRPSVIRHLKKLQERDLTMTKKQGGHHYLTPKARRLWMESVRELGVALGYSARFDS